jgi:hypothetical protein
MIAWIYWKILPVAVRYKKKSWSELWFPHFLSLERRNLSKFCHGPLNFEISSHLYIVSSKHQSEFSQYQLLVKNLKYFKDRIGILLLNCKNITLSSFKKKTKNYVRKQFLIYWEKHREISLTASKLTSYFLFMDNFAMEKYLTIKSLELRKTLCRFRISAHN